MFVEPMPPEYILWDVIEKHHEEANFHFEIWESGLHSPVYVLDQVRKGLEPRLRQHIAGVLTAGERGAERLLYPELEEMTSPQNTTLATAVMLGLSQRDVFYELLDYLYASNDEEQRRAIIRGAGLSDDPGFDIVLSEALVRARSPREKALLLRVFAALHLDPEEMIKGCFGTGFAALEVAAIKAVGRSGRRDLISMVERSLDADDLDLRRAAIDAGLFLGSTNAWSICREWAKSKDALAPWAMVRVAMLGTIEDHAIIHEHLDDESTQQAALWAMGYTGRIQSAELCLRYVESDDERTAKLAAEAFGEITGLSGLTQEFLAAKPSKDAAEAGDDEPLSLDDDDLDEDLELDATDELPLLDPFSVASWYEKNRHRFSKNERYLLGNIYSADSIIEALITFPMRRRHELAIELALRTGARRWVTTDAFARRQVRELKQLLDLEESELINRFSNE